MGPHLAVGECPKNEIDDQDDNFSVKQMTMDAKRHDQMYGDKSIVNYLCELDELRKKADSPALRAETIKWHVHMEGIAGDRLRFRRELPWPGGDFEKHAETIWKNTPGHWRE
jgi:hypothetical protein